MTFFINTCTKETGRCTKKFRESIMHDMKITPKHAKRWVEEYEECYPMISFFWSYSI